MKKLLLTGPPKPAEVPMNKKLLRELRAASGLTLMEIGHAARLHHSTVYRVFAGRDTFDPKTLEAVVKVMRKAIEQNRAKADELLGLVRSAQGVIR